ncbi:MAG: ribosomal protein S18-alanine N-acetyltransferase [Candidatus Latescibacteria bacterium]|nr:ribosomal protein S18-alanine N-acetyltransferase [Candidatus Latescibacterota bacterium]
MRIELQPGISEYTLREMGAGHLDAVVSIEREGFADPWQERDFEDALNRRNSYCLVYLNGKRVVAYAVGFFVANEYHLANLAVHPAFRRRGLGGRFLEAMLKGLPERNADVVTLEVRVSNLSAIGLYRKTGFRTVAIRRGYYTSPAEDALVMLKALHGRFSEWVNGKGTALR